MTATAGRGALQVPELGPALGRLVAPPPGPAAAHWIPLDDIRLALVTQVFELAGDARRWAREGDRELALATLDREAWTTAWRVAVGSVAQRAAGAISERLLSAAAEARIPTRRARRLVLDQRETLALAGRLGRGTAGLEEALATLERSVAAARHDRAGGEGARAWQEALGGCARRLEAAWLALEEALQAEWRSWESEVEAVRRWHRPRWPLIAIVAVVFGLAAWLGLVLGGYLPVPGPLRGFAEAIWARWS